MSAWIGPATNLARRHLVHNSCSHSGLLTKSNPSVWITSTLQTPDILLSTDMHFSEARLLHWFTRYSYKVCCRLCSCMPFSVLVCTCIPWNDIKSWEDTHHFPRMHILCLNTSKRFLLRSKAVILLIYRHVHEVQNKKKVKEIFF